MRHVWASRLGWTCAEPYATVVVAAPSRARRKEAMAEWWVQVRPGTWVDGVWPESANTPAWMEAKRPVADDPVRWYVCVEGACGHALRHRQTKPGRQFNPHGESPTHICNAFRRVAAFAQVMRGDWVVASDVVWMAGWRGLQCMAQATACRAVNGRRKSAA